VLSYVELEFRVSIWECNVLPHDVPGLGFPFGIAVLSHVELGFWVSIWECSAITY